MGAAAVPLMVGATVLSTYAGVQTSRANAAAGKAAAAAEAQRAAIAANNAAAIASVQKGEVQRKIDLTLSRARALAAASGTVVPEEMFGAIAERGAEQRQLIDWQTRTQGAQMRDASAVRNWQADVGGNIARAQQIATVLGGAAQIAGIAYKHGGGGAQLSAGVEFTDDPYGFSQPVSSAWEG